MSAVITPEMRRMARTFRRLGPSFVSPEWQDCDGFDEAVERRADTLISDPDYWCDLFEQAAADVACREAMVAFFNEPVVGSDRAARANRALKSALSDVAQKAAAKELDCE